VKLQIKVILDVFFFFFCKEWDVLPKKRHLQCVKYRVTIND
jgi:hypothetical protein